MKKIILFTMALVGTISAWGVDRTAITDASGFANALSNGGNYILSNNITVATYYTTIESVDIDLNNKTITCSANAGKYFITCSTSNKTIAFSNGTITMSVGLWGTFDCESGCSINLNKVTINNSRSDGKHNIYCNGSGSKTFTDCTINSTGCGGISIGGGSATITNCTISLTGVSTLGGWRSSCVAVSSGASATVNRGKYTSNDAASILVMNSGGTINVSDGTFISNATSAPYVKSSAGNYTGAVFCDKGGIVNLNGGTFKGYMFCKNENNAKINISNSVFTTNDIIGGDANPATHVAYTTGDTVYVARDGMYFAGYKAYTGSSIDDVKPYTDYAAAIADSKTTFNLCATNTISANTTLSGVTITQKGNADAFEVTDGTLTVQGTTTITANGEYNAVNVNGANAKLIVPENQDNVIIGKLTKTNGEINLYAGTYNQDITAFLPQGYEQDPTTGKVKKATPAEPYTRSGLTVGTMGTICLNQDVKAGNFTGAIFYKTAYRVGDSKIFFDEVDSLIAGRAYIFEATATELSCILSGTAAAAPVAENGLYGTFEGINCADPIGQASESDEKLKDMYLINNNTVRRCGTGCWLAPNRAYIKLKEVSTTSTPAPGRRITLVNADANTPTFIVETEANAQTSKKVMMNGQFVIFKDGKMFNAQGAEL